MVGHSSALMQVGRGLELPWASRPTGDGSQMLGNCGEVCADCDNQNAPFVTKMHKGRAIGSVLFVSGPLVLLIDV